MRRLAPAAVIAILACALSLLTAAPSEARGKFRVSATALNPSVVLGQRVRISGRVTPNAPGSRVLLQKRSAPNAPWLRVGTTTVGADGSYLVGDTPASARRLWYRVLKPRAKRKKAGISRVLQVNVTAPPPAPPAPRWYYLTDLPQPDRSRDMTTDAVRINGSLYAKSLVSDDQGTYYTEYNLSRKCTQLTGVLGMSDDSATKTQNKVELFSDSRSIYSRTFSLGQAESRTFDVTGVLRLRFQTTTDKYSAYGAFGSPRVLCSSNPT